MTPDIQLRIQELGYNPERAAEALPTLIKVAQAVMRAGNEMSPAKLKETQTWADAALSMSRNF